MKKLFLLAVAVVFAFSMNAQKIGVKVGYGMSGYLVNFYVPDGAKMGKGLNAGLIGEYGLNDLLGLRLDVGYNAMGSDYEETADLAGVEVTTKLKNNVKYLNIGVSAKASFGPAYAFVGPYFGYALSYNAWYSVKAGPIPAVIVEQDMFADPVDGGTGDLFNKIDFGANLGVGINLKNFFIEANAGMGLANFYNTGSDYYDMSLQYADGDGTAMTEDLSQKNLFFGLSFGYMIGF